MPRKSKGKMEWEVVEEVPKLPSSLLDEQLDTELRAGKVIAVSGVTYQTIRNRAARSGLKVSTRKRNGKLYVFLPQEE